MMKVIYLVEDAKTYSSRWVDVRVEESRRELALGRFSGVVLRELHRDGIKSWSRR